MQIDNAHNDLTPAKKAIANITPQKEHAKLRDTEIRISKSKLSSSIVDEVMEPHAQTKEMTRGSVQSDRNSLQRHNIAPHPLAVVDASEACAMDGDKGHQDQSITSQKTQPMEKSADTEMADEFRGNPQEIEGKEAASIASLLNPIPPLTADNAHTKEPDQHQTQSSISKDQYQGGQPESMAQELGARDASRYAITFDGSGLEVSADMMYYATNMW